MSIHTYEYISAYVCIYLRCIVCKVCEGVDGIQVSLGSELFCGGKASMSCSSVVVASSISVSVFSLFLQAVVFRDTVTFLSDGKTKEERDRRSLGHLVSVSMRPSEALHYVGRGGGVKLLIPLCLLVYRILISDTRERRHTIIDTKAKL